LHTRIASVATVTVAGLLLAAPAMATFPGRPGRIVFDAATVGRSELVYDVDPRTGKRRELTTGATAASMQRGSAAFRPRRNLR
jgi:hypothetical protein